MRSPPCRRAADINITSGHNINLVAAQLEADRDVNLKAANDVNLLAAQDVSNYEHVHKELFAGVSATVSSSLVSAANNLSDARDKAGEAGSDLLPDMPSFMG